MRFATKENLRTIVTALRDEMPDVDMLGTDPNDAGPLLSLQAEGWAEQTQLSGKNLCPTMNVTTIDGLTSVVNSDGSVTVTGTITSNDVFITPSITTTLGAGTYTLSGAVDADICIRVGTSSSLLGHATNKPYTFTLSEQTDVKVRLRIQNKNGQSVNVTFYPMLELGSTATSYEPYCGGIPSPNPDYPQEIRVARGRNLFDKNNVVSGVVLSSDGSISTDSQNWRTSDYIYVHGMSSIVGSGNNGSVAAANGGAWYAKDKTFLRYFGANAIRNGKSVSVPSDAYYVRVSSVVADLDTYQLEEGSTFTPYVLYDHIGMEIQGKNLLDPSIFAVSDTKSGITYTNNGDGSVTIKGTATAYSAYYLMYNNHDWSRIRNKVVSMSVDVALPSGMSLGMYNASWASVGRLSGSTIQTTFTAMDATYMYFDVANGMTVDVTIYPMVELGTEATDYEPYIHKTIPIPLPSKGFAAALPDGTSDVLRLDGAGGYEWTENVGEFKHSDLSYSYDSNTRRFESTQASYANLGVRGSSSDLRKIPMIDEAFAVKYGGESYDASWDNVIYSGGSTILIHAHAYTTATDLMAAVGDFTVLYPLATPTTEQGYLDDWDNCIPLHATIDIPELRDIGVECYLSEESARASAQWSKRIDTELGDAIVDLAENVVNVESKTKVDGSTIKRNSNGELYVDIPSLMGVSY